MKGAPLTLLQLNKKVKSLMKEGLDSYWVVGEISELSINYSGHCYLELVEKSEKTEQLVARSRAVIWANTFRMLQPYFETTTGQSFQEGLKVMVRVVVEFHEVYGLSLNIVDIEPTYTVGELTVRKRKILEKLDQEGVLYMNKELDLPELTNRIAIISSKTAAGLGDFENQLHNNSSGFKFYSKLFPAVMQGNEAEGSIISQLDKIFEHAEHFDAVIIIRGGGASADLECFNSYWLAYHITQFPIPVLTGIGHEQDDTVTDEVAHTRLKTPTAVAEFLVNKLAELESELLGVEQEIISEVKDVLYDKKQNLNLAAIQLQKIVGTHVRNENKKLSHLNLSYLSAVQQSIFKQHQKLNRSASQLSSSAKNLIQHRKHTLHIDKLKLTNSTNEQQHLLQFGLEKLAQRLEYAKPEEILRRGYSITYKDGKSIKEARELKKGDTIKTVFYKGSKTSEIK